MASDNVFNCSFHNVASSGMILYYYDSIIACFSVIVNGENEVFINRRLSSGRKTKEIVRLASQNPRQMRQGEDIGVAEILLPFAHGLGSHAQHLAEGALGEMVRPAVFLDFLPDRDLINRCRQCPSPSFKPDAFQPIQNGQNIFGTNIFNDTRRSPKARLVYHI